MRRCGSGNVETLFCIWLSDSVKAMYLLPKLLTVSKNKYGEKSKRELQEVENKLSDLCAKNNYEKIKEEVEI